jgi:hypothetical protein
MKTMMTKKPAKKYAMGGGVPNTGMQAPPKDMAAKQPQMMAQQSEMAKSAPQSAPYMPGGGAAPTAPAQQRRYTSADALRYLRRTGNKAGAEQILRGAVGKQFTMPSDFAKGGVVKKKTVAAKGKKK